MAQSAVGHSPTMHYLIGQYYYKPADNKRKSSGNIRHFKSCVPLPPSNTVSIRDVQSKRLSPDRVTKKAIVLHYATYPNELRNSFLHSMHIDVDYSVRPAPRQPW